MKYSRWRPDTGGYDYFEAADRFGLGDDLPVPRLTGGTDIGIASTDIGRNPIAATRPAGSGRTPQGSIMPLSRQGLSGGVFEAMNLLGSPVQVRVQEQDLGPRLLSNHMGAVQTRSRSC